MCKVMRAYIIGSRHGILYIFFHDHVMSQTTVNGIMEVTESGGGITLFGALARRSTTTICRIAVWFCTESLHSLYFWLCYSNSRLISRESVQEDTFKVKDRDEFKQNNQMESYNEEPVHCWDFKPARDIQCQ